MFFAGRLVGRADMRLIIATGLALVAVSFWGMGRFSLQMDGFAIAWTGFVQGLGTGLIFMPVTNLAFVSLSPMLRADGAGVFTLMRNLGNSVGVSIMQAQFVRSTRRWCAPKQVEAWRRSADALALALAGPFSLVSRTGLAALDGEITRQASMVAYVGIFQLMFISTLAMVPLLLLLRRPRVVVAMENQPMEH